MEKTKRSKRVLTLIAGGSQLIARLNKRESRRERNYSNPLTTAAKWIQSIIISSVLLGSSIAPLSAMSASEYRATGLRYRQQGQFSEAIAALQKAFELEPENSSNGVLLGWTLHLAGQEQESATVLKQTLQQNATDVPALNALGIVYLMNDDPVAAALTHAAAAWLKPDNEIAYYNLSLALEQLTHYEWAVDTAQKAVELEPNNPHPLVALAIAQWQNGDQSAAKETYQQAIDLDSRYQSSSFLNALDQAGFSEPQIEKAKQLLKISSPGA